MNPTEFQSTIRDYRSRIDTELRSLVRSQEPDYLYGPVQYVLKGQGKRLRPTLLLLVARLFRVSEDVALPAALSVEILHNFSLIHDDIMDQDDLRHGLPSVFRKWDESTAILTGDVLFAMAYGELAKVKSNPLACVRALNVATVKLCEGQALDKSFESREDVILKEYLNMIRLKTATLLSLCCQLGAILGKASQEKEREIGLFGELLGQAFQIQDDVLEIYSDVETMGKSLGSDVATGKKTYLTCRALEKDSDAWNRLMTSLKGENLESEALPAMRVYFEESGVMGEAKNEIRRILSLSRAKLDLFPVEARQNLDHFVNMLMARER
ncbi:MAG: polyprenyl synthetase family protein [Candidatus Neomarinimicrobiota bacterium]